MIVTTIVIKEIVVPIQISGELVQVKKTYCSGTIKNHVKNQKQPPEVLCENRYCEKFHEIHRKAPVPGSLF